MVAAELAIGTRLGVHIVPEPIAISIRLKRPFYWILRITHKLHFSYRGWPPYMTMNMRNNHSLLFIIPRFVVLNPYGYGRKGMRFALLISGSSSPLCLDGCMWRCDGMGCHLPGWATSSLHSSPFLLGCMVSAVVEPSRILMMIDRWSCGLPGFALVRVI